MLKINNIILTIFLTLIFVSNSSCTSNEAFENDSDIISEIDEATDGMKDSSEDELLSDNEDSEESVDSEYSDNESSENEEVAEANGEEDEFSDEDFKDEEGEQVAENSEEFEDFADEDAEREIAQTDEEPSLEALDDEASKEFNEPATENSEENLAATDEFQKYPEPTLESTDENFSSETAEDSTLVSGQTWIPVKKIKDTPFYRNGRLLNTVYIVRKDFDLASLSQKIFGSDKSEILLQDNPHLAKGLKTGDKIYYNSPSRPMDSTQLKVAYEDIGQMGEEYLTKVGDNIRVFSNKLLGFNDAWKEVWATNPNVESKDVVQEGLSLRFWREDLGSNSIPSLAQTAKPGNSEIADNSLSEDFNSEFDENSNQTSNQITEPTESTQSTDLASENPDPNQNNINEQAIVAQTEVVPPPPPNMNDITPPQEVAQTPPPPAMNQQNSPNVSGSGTIEVPGLGPVDNTSMIYGALALLALVALFIKKKKSTRGATVFEATQV